MKKQAKKETRFLGVNAVAERLKITPRRIQQLRAEGLPREKHGRYDIDKVLDWYIAKLEKQIAGGSDEEGSIGYNKERARDRAAAADLKEMKLAQQRRTLVSIPDVEKIMTDLVVSTKAAILAVPGRISQSLVGAEPGAIRDKLEHELKSALQKLSAIRPKIEAPSEPEQSEGGE